MSPRHRPLTIGRINVKRLYATFKTKLGWTTVVWREDLVIRLTFGHRNANDSQCAAGLQRDDSKRINRRKRELLDRLHDFALGQPQEFSDTRVDYACKTNFSLRVLRHCQQIPWGETLTYAQLAALSGSPRAARAVGNIMSRNRVPLIIPCHRVVGYGNSLGGFSAPTGTAMKKRLLAMESRCEAAVVNGCSRGTP
jgi:methylated-DNA-[protein]-cysteine S-methyltransferase